ncbi:MAG: hypothetical protein F6J93_01525 [Oscillatoria sp. SIO1A7]|nr:hypothetical protein [Oscillatoria sp. SIO1A7]
MANLPVMALSGGALVKLNSAIAIAACESNTAISSFKQRWRYYIVWQRRLFVVLKIN